MALKTVNIEKGRPMCEEAMRRLSQELRIARAGRLPAIKIIHGYGSTGQGGAIKTAAHRLLRERLSRGEIKAFVAGEDFSAFTNAGRAAVAARPELRNDIDFGRQNDGITVVLL